MDIDEIVSEMEELRRRGYGEYVTVKGIKTRYFVIGSGSPVLLVHGFGAFLETWGFNILPLSKRYQVYAMDLPGHGLSDKSKGCYTPAFVTEFTSDFINALGIKRTSMIGHSLGGLISLNTAVNLPERVNRLILVDSAGLSQKLPLRYRLCSVPGLGNILMKSVTKPVLERGIRRLFYNPNFLPDEILDVVVAISQGSGAKEALLSMLQDNVGLTGMHPELVMADKLHLVKSPTLLIHGVQDKLIPLEHARKAYHLIPNASLKIFNECGHCPNIEKAAEFNEAVIAFLEANESGSLSV